MTETSPLENLSLPRDLHRLITLLHQKNILPTLVGGGVRKFLVTKGWGEDLDFDLRALSFTSQEKWGATLKALEGDLRHHFKVERRKFSVLKVEAKGRTVELAPARFETYGDSPPYAHGEFSIDFAPNAPLEESFKRRDFTVNALGVEFWPVKTVLVDPFGGQKHLDDKILIPCSEDFFKDPVRFLRLIRFSLQDSWKISQELRERLSLFDLRKLKPFYFFKEALKTDFSRFAKMFFELTRKHHLPHPFASLTFLERYPLPKEHTQNLKDVFLSLLYHPSPPSHPQLESLVAAMNLKESLLKKHLHLRSVLEGCSPFEEDVFIRGFSQKQPFSFLQEEKWIPLAKARTLLLRDYREECLWIKINPPLKKTITALLSLFPQKLLGQKHYEKWESQCPSFKRSLLALWAHLVERGKM